MTVCQRIFATPQNITFIVVGRKANFDGLLGMDYVVLRPEVKKFGYCVGFIFQGVDECVMCYMVFFI